MKANEFVKKYGISAASELVNESEWSIKQLALATTTSMLDLKRLVESHEVVEQFGGLEKAMDAVINQEANSRPMGQLAQAIADVESCL
ncbi:hypothetical protein ACX2CK_06295 [Acinetobacter schindleri]